MSQHNKTVIAIHGAGMNAGVWGTLAPELACRAISLPGHGETPGPLLPSIGAMAEWVETQIKDYPAKSVVLMGHSMGALVALEAARHPAVAALVLMGAAVHMPVHPDLLKQASEAPSAAAGMILKWGVSSAHSQVAEALRSQMQPAALANDLTACNNYQNGAAAAKAVRQPVLVLSGSDDKLTKAAEGRALTDALPHARFHLIAGSGHMLMVEGPLETAREISTFIASLNS